MLFKLTTASGYRFSGSMSNLIVVRRSVPPAITHALPLYCARAVVASTTVAAFICVNFGKLFMSLPPYILPKALRILSGVKGCSVTHLPMALCTAGAIRLYVQAPILSPMPFMP